MSDWQGFSPLNDFTGPLLDNLKRHPKRIVFPEGEDVRVLRVSERFVAEQAGVPILLGRKEVIRRMAEMNGISLKFVRIIEPEKSSDLQMFCDRYERAEQMFGNGLPMNTREIVSEPVHFAAMMVLYGQADAIVAGNMKRVASVFRAVNKYRQEPVPTKPLFAISIVLVPEFAKKFGGRGIYFLADTGVTPDPTVENMAYFAVETAKMARHMLGKSVRVAMLSASTAGSVPELAADRTRAATALARSMVQKDCLNNEISVEGEIQIDAALSPDSYSVRVHRNSMLQPSDVWVFPTLDAADISKKLLCMMPSVYNYGLILGGLLFPIAQLPRLTDEDRMFGTALVVGNEAIKFPLLYPQGGAPLY